ncbi:MAG: hypothetical protein JNM95_02130 [Chitinophagaceae bacterium]|nr:hypothetical protein [Chitinophagaceae bacterium]
MMLKRIILLWLFFLPNFLFAQTDSNTVSSTPVKKVVLAPFPDSIFRFNTIRPIPKRAALFSALLPGLGQVYNKNYWKTGVVAVGAGVITYFIVSNRKDYLTYQKDYIYRIDDNPNTVTSFPNYSTDDVNLLRTGFRKYYEYSIIAASVAYLVNILDAYTSAHLKTFDMSKDISYHFTPGNSAQPVALGISISFK